MEDTEVYILSRKSKSSPNLPSLSTLNKPKGTTLVNSHSTLFKVLKEDDKRRSTDLTEKCAVGGEVERFEKSELEDTVTAVFSWTYGGKEVYLVGETKHGTQRLKMVKSGNCFTLIQELPKDLCKYRYLVDGVLQHDPDQPVTNTKDGPMNVIDARAIIPANYNIPRQSEEINNGVFGHMVPGPNYLALEPPAFPDILAYREPDFDNPSRISSDIHVLANHVYKDTKSREFFGPNYASYITIYRWNNEAGHVVLSSRCVTIIYVTNVIADDSGSSSESDTFEYSRWLRIDE